MRVDTEQMRSLILLLLCSYAYSAKVTKAIYAIGDTSCVGTPSMEPSFFVAEEKDSEGCTNLGTPLATHSVRNRYCDQSYQIYHEETFSEPACICTTSPSICVKEWQLGVCTLIGQIPMIVQCTDWQTQLPNSVTTVVNITTHVHNTGDNITVVNEANHTYHNHAHYNVTNITRIVNETVTNVVEKAVNTTITEEVWGVSEAAFFWGSALVFFAVIAIGYFIYATITTNKKEELKAKNMGAAYGLIQKERPRRNRIF